MGLGLRCVWAQTQVCQIFLAYLNIFLPVPFYAPLLLIEYCAFMTVSCYLVLYHCIQATDPGANDVNCCHDVWTLCSSVQACQSYDIWGLASGMSGLTLRYENNLFIASLIVPYNDPNLPCCHDHYEPET